jgi:hypothetical protein
LNDADRFFQTFVYHLRPHSAEEATLCAEIDDLPASRVLAGNNDALVAIGFLKGECHRNCIRAAAEGQGTQVFGWTVTPLIYLSHSVLRTDGGRLRCITPYHTDELDETGSYEFREDTAFTFDGTYMRRNSVYPPRSISIIRRNAEFVRQHYSDLYERVRRRELTFDDARELGL